MLHISEAITLLSDAATVCDEWCGQSQPALIRRIHPDEPRVRGNRQPRGRYQDNSWSLQGGLEFGLDLGPPVCGELTIGRPGGVDADQPGHSQQRLSAEPTS
jgi:hypothetical protein